MKPPATKGASSPSSRTLPRAEAPDRERWELVLERIVPLNPGAEWKYGPTQFRANDLICLRCDSSVKFYAGLFTDAVYQAKLRTATNKLLGFPFPLGSDKPSYEESVQVSVPTGYWIVLRVGQFAREAQISATLWKAAPQPPTRLRVLTSVGAAIGLVILVGLTAWYDAAVIGLGNAVLIWTVVGVEIAGLGGLAAVFYKILWQRSATSRG